MKNLTRISVGLWGTLLGCAPSFTITQGLAIHIEQPADDEEEPPLHELHIYLPRTEDQVELSADYVFTVEGASVARNLQPGAISEFALEPGEYSVFTLTRSGEGDNACVHCAAGPSDAGVCVFRVSTDDVTEVDGDARTWVSDVCDQ